jgi:hypothetical protein
MQSATRHAINAIQRDTEFLLQLKTTTRMVHTAESTASRRGSPS